MADGLTDKQLTRLRALCAGGTVSSAEAAENRDLLPHALATLDGLVAKLAECDELLTHATEFDFGAFAAMRTISPPEPGPSAEDYPRPWWVIDEDGSFIAARRVREVLKPADAAGLTREEAIRVARDLAAKAKTRTEAGRG